MPLSKRIRKVNSITAIDTWTIENNGHRYVNTNLVSKIGVAVNRINTMFLYIDLNSSAPLAGGTQAWVEGTIVINCG